MRYRIFLNLALLALVAALGLIVFNHEDDDVPRKLSTLEADTIDSIEIRHRDRYVVLKRQDDGWHMTRPINIAANDFRIDSLLKFIDTTPHASYAVEEVDLGRFKLDTPTTSIRFGDMLFEFGNTNPINRLRYIKVGDSMHMIDDNFYPLVSSQLGTLIAPALLPEGASIGAIRLPGLQLSRKDDSWDITPTNEAISTDDIRTLVDNWENVKAFGVNDYFERETLGSVTIDHLIGGVSERTSFIITDTDPWLILARPELGIEYHLAIENYDQLFSLHSDHERSVLDAEEALIHQ